MTRETGIAATGMPEIPFRAVDLAIAEIAGRQHGVIALAQLVDLGLSPRAVRARVAAGRLHRVHRGVYAVGHSSLTAKARWMAAVLASGEGSLLSHRSNGALTGIRPSASALIEVTVPGEASNKRGGIRVYGRSDLTAADMTTVDGIPCTSVARTLLDLAAVLDDAAVEKAIDRAEQLRVFDGRAVDDVLARNAGRRGAGRLRRVLANLDPGSGRTRREFERRFFAFCRDRNLPVPQVNVPIQLEDILFIADFLWPTARLIIETDSWEIHGTRVAFHRDRRRDQLLDRADYRTLRVTWRDLTEEPDRLEDTIRHRLTSADNRTPLSREAALDRAA